MPEKMAAYWLAARVVLRLLSNIIQDHFPKGCTAHSGLGPPISIIYQENALQTWLQANLKTVLSQFESSSSQMVLYCAKLTTNYLSQCPPSLLASLASVVPYQLCLVLLQTHPFVSPLFFIISHCVTLPYRNDSYMSMDYTLWPLYLYVASHILNLIFLLEQIST